MRIESGEPWITRSRRALLDARSARAVVLHLCITCALLGGRVTQCTEPLPCPERGYQRTKDRGIGPRGFKTHTHRGPSPLVGVSYNTHTLGPVTLGPVGTSAQHRGDVFTE